MTDRRRATLSWPDDGRLYLTLDFECDFGTALPENEYEALDYASEFVSTMEDHDVPVTCFVQTEVLDERPEAVETLRSCSTPVRFHPHSHTHRPRERTSIEDEIGTSTDRYREFFGAEPTGYRFPNGNVREADYRLLAERGYDFDASVFPTWRPRHFDNTDAPTVPQYLPSYDLFEVPFTVYHETLRVPTALSYCRLLGRPYTWLLTWRRPSVVVFNVHMHDLATPSTVSKLPRTYRMVYGRNDDGFDRLERVLESFAASGYSFGTLDDVHDALRDGNDVGGSYSR